LPEIDGSATIKEPNADELELIQELLLPYGPGELPDEIRFKIQKVRALKMMVASEVSAEPKVIIAKLMQKTKSRQAKDTLEIIGLLEVLEQAYIRKM